MRIPDSLKRRLLYPTFLGGFGALFVDWVSKVTGLGAQQELHAADYTVLAADSGKTFVATAAAIFALPTAAEGLEATFVQTANANLTVSATAGSIITKGDAAANSVAYSTTDEKIGAICHFVAIEVTAGTWKWLHISLCTHTVTVVT